MNITAGFFMSRFFLSNAATQNTYVIHITHTNADGITEYAINRLIAGRISTIATSMLLTYTTVKLIMYAIISTQRNIASDSCPCAAIYALLSDDETIP